MRKLGSITCEGDRPATRRYTAAREPEYHGNPDMIDADGTKAAEHMAVADALRTVEKMLRREKALSESAQSFHGTRKEYDAIALMTRALRVKHPALGHLVAGRRRA